MNGFAGATTASSSSSSSSSSPPKAGTPLPAGDWVQKHILVVGLAAFVLAWFLIFLTFMVRWGGGGKQQGYQTIAPDAGRGTEMPTGSSPRSQQQQQASAAAAAAVASFHSTYQPASGSAHGSSSLDEI